MKVALFITCMVDTFLPRIGQAVVRVLRRFGCEVEFPAGQTCCGQPAFNSGFHVDAAAVARQMIRAFEPHELIVTPSASCATMVRRHFPELLASDPTWHAHAQRLADRTYEFTQFLALKLNVRIEDHLRFDEPVTFHYPCHAREIYQPADLQRLLAATAGEHLRPPGQVDLCCGFGGLFSVDYSDISAALLAEKLATLETAGTPNVVCNEAGCTLQIAGGAHRNGRALKCKHIAEHLAESLGLMADL